MNWLDAATASPIKMAARNEGPTWYHCTIDGAVVCRSEEGKRRKMPSTYADKHTDWVSCFVRRGYAT